jgi:hypothetical protein
MVALVKWIFQMLFRQDNLILIQVSHLIIFPSWTGFSFCSNTAICARTESFSLKHARWHLTSHHIGSPDPYFP